MAEQVQNKSLAKAFWFERIYLFSLKTSTTKILLVSHLIFVSLLKMCPVHENSISHFFTKTYSASSNIKKQSNKKLDTQRQQNKMIEKIFMQSQCTISIIFSKCHNFEIITVLEEFIEKFIFYLVIENQYISRADTNNMKKF